MLAKPDYTRRTVVRPSRPLRLEYAEYIQQRIEDHKNQLTRKRLMALADEAVRTMNPGSDGQLALTEVLVGNGVDDIIASSLNLPRFTKWKNGYVKRRLAQRQITHWKTIHPDSSLSDLVLYLEPGEKVLLIGKGCAEHAYFIAAHESEVTFVAGDVKSVDAAEHRAAAESLSPRLEAFAVDLGGTWFPDVTPSLVLVDVGDLFALDRKARELIVAKLQEITLRGGTHNLFAASAIGRDGFDMEMSHLRNLYSGWETRAGGAGNAEILAVRIE